MSRSFTRSSSQYLKALQTAVTGPAFSMSCWFYCTNTTENMSLMCLADASSHVDIYQLIIRGGVAGDPVSAQSRDSSGSTFADSTSGYSDSVWHHACGVWPSSSAQKVWLDGGSEGTASGTKSPGGIDHVSIGGTTDASPGNYMDGRIAEAAIWAAALSAGEVSILAKGYSPLFVRPQDLVMYWALIRESASENEDIDKVGGHDFVDYNGPGDAAHPRVLNPAPFVLGGLQGVVAVTPLVRRAIEKY